MAEARMLALQACSGVDMPNIPPPTAEEREQMMALMREYDLLCQENTHLFSLAVEAMIALMESQAQSRPVVPLPLPQFQGPHSHNAQAQPASESAQHVRNLEPHGALPMAPVPTLVSRQMAGNTDFNARHSTTMQFTPNPSQPEAIQTQRAEVPPTSLRSHSAVPNPPSTPAPSRPLTVMTTPETTRRTVPVGGQHEGVGSVQAEGRQPRRGRRTRRRNRQQRYSAREEVVNYLKLPTAAMAA